MARPAVLDRVEILDAAAVVIQRDGGIKLTMERVAKEAGISKGGLLHLFPSKRTLLEGLMQRFVNTMAASVHMAADAHSGDKLKAYVAAHFKGIRDDSVYCSLFTAAVNDPDLLQSVSDFFTQRLKDLAGVDFPKERAALVLMAVEGAAMFHAMGIRPLTNVEERRLVAEVYRVIDWVS